MKTRYQKLVDALDMTQQGAARFLGISPRHSRRYYSGEVLDEEVPEVILMLLALMVKKNIKPDLVRRIADLPAVVVGDARVKADAE